MSTPYRKPRTVWILAVLLGLLLLANLVHAGTARAARTPAAKQAWQYRWWTWMPPNWQQLGACETGYGRRPGNFHHHNSSYVSAFGISRREYDRDAAYMGGPPWNDAHPPTPWQQYRAAVGHYRRFGDGWGCPGP